MTSGLCIHDLHVSSSFISVPDGCSNLCPRPWPRAVILLRHVALYKGFMPSARNNSHTDLNYNTMTCDWLWKTSTSSLMDAQTWLHRLSFSFMRAMNDLAHTSSSRFVLAPHGTEKLATILQLVYKIPCKIPLPKERADLPTGAAYDALYLISSSSVCSPADR